MLYLDGRHFENAFHLLPRIIKKIQWYEYLNTKVFVPF